MKGFTIKCNECGRETMMTSQSGTIERDNAHICVAAAGYDGEIQIYCDCENIIKDEY